MAEVIGNFSLQVQFDQGSNSITTLFAELCPPPHGSLSLSLASFHMEQKGCSCARLFRRRFRVILFVKQSDFPLNQVSLNSSLSFFLYRTQKNNWSSHRNYSELVGKEINHWAISFTFGQIWFVVMLFSPPFCLRTGSRWWLRPVVSARAPHRPPASKSLSRSEWESKGIRTTDIVFWGQEPWSQFETFLKQKSILIVSSLPHATVQFSYIWIIQSFWQRGPWLQWVGLSLRNQVWTWTTGPCLVSLHHRCLGAEYHSWGCSGFIFPYCRLEITDDNFLRLRPGGRWQLEFHLGECGLLRIELGGLNSSSLSFIVAVTSLCL